MKSSGVISRELTIRGELVSQGDVVVEGRVEGSIQLDHGLTIRPDAVVEADVQARTVTVSGRVQGTVRATERVRLEATAVVHGDVRAPVVEIEDGAHVQGRIDMHVEIPAHAREVIG